ncbi:MAG: hypothetical protein ACK5QJ_12450 [Microcystis sp.]|uniref:hypothetical protein n=1 Tax=Microcystis sp. TaxID=1127 RepID=UPI00391C72F4
MNNFCLYLTNIGLEVSYQLSVISYQLTEKTPHTLHPTPYTLHPVPRKNFLPQTLDREQLVS